MDNPTTNNPTNGVRPECRYRQSATRRRKGCQIDLLLQADRKVCVVEIKRRATIGREVIDEVESKVRSLSLPAGVSVRTALVYEGTLAKSVEAEGYFDALVPVESLMYGSEKELAFGRR